MATKNFKISIILEEETVGLLSILAKQENKSIASLAKELIIASSVDRYEDMVLFAIAEDRDVKHAKIIDHEDAWK